MMISVVFLTMDVVFQWRNDGTFRPIPGADVLTFSHWFRPVRIMRMPCFGGFRTLLRSWPVIILVIWVSFMELALVTLTGFFEWLRASRMAAGRCGTRSFGLWRLFSYGHHRWVPLRRLLLLSLLCLLFRLTRWDCYFYRFLFLSDCRRSRRRFSRIERLLFAFEFHYIVIGGRAWLSASRRCRPILRVGWLVI